MKLVWTQLDCKRRDRKRYSVFLLSNVQVRQVPDGTVPSILLDRTFHLRKSEVAQKLAGQVGLSLPSRPTFTIQLLLGRKTLNSFEPGECINNGWWVPGFFRLPRGGEGMRPSGFMSQTSENHTRVILVGSAHESLM